MRLNLILSVALVLSGCVEPIRPYGLTCLPGPVDEECAAVADAVIVDIAREAAERGAIQSVQVTSVPDCGRLARSMLEPEVGPPHTVRCWAVRGVWHDGGPTWVVTLGRDGSLRVYP